MYIMEKLKILIFHELCPYPCLHKGKNEYSSQPKTWFEVSSDTSVITDESVVLIRKNGRKTHLVLSRTEMGLTLKNSDGFLPDMSPDNPMHSH